MLPGKVGRQGLIAKIKATGAPADGKWFRAKVDDAGTPLGAGFKAGDGVFCRRCGPDEYIILKPGIRRFITRAQYADFICDIEDAHPDQAIPQRLCDALEPQNAKELLRGVPSAYKGMPVVLSDTTPAVKEPGWEADWDDERIYLERRVVQQMIRKGGIKKWVAEALAHEWYEMECAERIAGERWPFAPVSERRRLMREVEGLAHKQTIRAVDGYSGPDAEQAYYRNDKRIMDKAGLGALVDNWPGYTTM